MSTSCAAICRHIDAYFDGELEPRTRAIVSGHLILCDSCRERMNHIREIGELLRARVAAPEAMLNLSGLASGVISRARAEESQSWRTWLHRGAEDWRWAMIGAGSLSAAIVSVVIAAAVVALGNRPEREDSLAALLNNLQAPAGRLWMIATPAGPDQAPMFMEFDSGARGDDRATPGEMPEGFSAPSEADLAVLLSNAVIGPDGRMTNLATMSKRNREQTEPLLLEIGRQRNALPGASWSGRRVNVQRLWLTTNASVSGKPLEP